MNNLQCKKCGDTIASEDLLSCGSCAGPFHFSCCGLGEKSFRRIGTRSKSLLCSECRLEKNSAIAESENASSVAHHDANIHASSGEGSATMTEATMNKICSKVIDGLSRNLRIMIADEFSALRGEMEGIKASVSFLSEEYDALKKKMSILDGLRDENNQLKNRISELERESMGFGVTIEKLSEDVNNREQYNRYENLEITGVPQIRDEDTRSIIHKISEKINLKLNDTDVIFCRRVSPWNDKGGTPQKLIVKFTKRNIVDNMLSAVRKRNGITARDLGFENDTSRIYLNCHLTPSNKRLLREVKLRAKTKEYQFCWVKHCMIYVRKDSKSPALLIRKSSDMKKII